MTRRVYLHVGAPKSGTTYLQQVLERNRARLGEAGVLVVGERHVDRVHAAMVVREDPRLDALPESASTAWRRLVEEIRAWPGESAILSYELFAGAEAGQVEAALADLHGLEVHVVITARDLGRSVPSAWQERLKFALTKPLESWRPRPESAGVRAEWGWRTMDPAGVAARWGASLPPERVHVVTVPRSGGDPGELWRRFAAACGIDVPGLVLDVPRANQSLGLVAAELLRRVNEQVAEPIRGNREHARWLRDTLAHRVLVPLDDEPIGLTDDQFADAEQRSAESVQALREAGYALHGDLDDILATRPQARTPGQAEDSELLDVAVRAVYELLLLLRERSLEQQPEEGAPRGIRAIGKGVVRRVTAPRRDRRHAELEARVTELEAQLAASRALQLRVAEVTDVVTELLLPRTRAKGRLSARAISRYRKASL